MYYIHIPDAFSVTALERQNGAMIDLEMKKARFEGYHLQASFCPAYRPKKEPKQRTEDSDDAGEQEYDFGTAFD